MRASYTFAHVLRCVLLAQLTPACSVFNTVDDSGHPTNPAAADSGAADWLRGSARPDAGADMTTISTGTPAMPVDVTPLEAMEDDLVASQVFDGGDYVYLVGSFKGRLSLGGHLLDSHGPQFDGYVAKVDRGGPVVWARSFGGDAEDLGLRVALDAVGHLLLLGRVTDAVELDGVEIGEGGRASFVAKLDADDGAVVWSRRLPSTTDFAELRDFARDLVVDEQGAIYVTGRHELPFELSPGGPSVPAVSFAEGYVAKYSPEGGALWVHRVASSDTSGGLALAIDSAGDVIVAGMVTGTADIAPSFAPGTQSTDAFLMKLGAADGERHWAVRYGGDALDYAMALSLREDDSILVAGRFDHDLRWGDETLTGDTGGVYVARATADGTPIGLTGFQSEGSSDVRAEATAVTSLPGGVAVCGYFSGSLRAAERDPMPSNGRDDLFVARFSDSGELQWASTYGGVDQDRALDLGVGPDGNLWVTGYIVGAVDFGPGVSADTGFHWGSLLLQLSP